MNSMRTSAPAQTGLSCRLLGDNDQRGWDGFIDRQPDASPYHYWAWGQSIAHAYEHGTRYFVAEQGGETMAALPVTVVRIPFKGKHGCSLPFCDFGGPVGKREVFDHLIQYVQQWQQAHRIPFIDLRTLGTPWNDEAGCVTPKVSMRMPLPDNPEELWRSFKSKLRSQINKAKKNGLSVETGRSQALINAFYYVFVRNMRDLGSPVHDVQLFRALLAHFQDRMTIGIVRYEGVPIGGGLTLSTPHITAIPWASTLRDYNRLAPNMLLYWALLENACERGSQWFDFGRSTKGEGTYRFKQQWGARPFTMHWQRRYRQGHTEELNEGTDHDSTLKTAVISVWQRLPLMATASLGPAIRKYITL